MDFVAIDFETANEKRYSACALGITKVVNDEIVEEKYWLIKPPEMRFVAQNTWIHGIFPEDVENEKNFKELWDEIKPYLENELVIAHNAAFDTSVLRALLDYYDLEYPSFQYACTVILSQNHIEDIKNHKLNTLAKYVGHEFKHHHAGEDATACAKVMLYICKMKGITDLVTLNLIGGLNIGYVYERDYKPCTSLIKRQNNISKKEALSYMNINENSLYFQDRVVVFTGPLESMKRNEASSLVTKLGGIVGSSVTKKTEILVTGIKNSSKLTEEYKSTKLRKAEALIKIGQKIDILTEEEFLKLTLNSY